MAASYDQISVGVDTGYPTFPLRPSAADVSSTSLAGFAGASGASATTFQPQNPYTVSSSNGFYDSGTDGALEPAVASVCISVSDEASFPSGQEAFMFPKGTVVTVLRKKGDAPKSRLRGTGETEYEAILRFSETAFNARKVIGKDANKPDLTTSKPHIASFQTNMKDLGLTDTNVTKYLELGASGSDQAENYTKAAELVPLGVLAEACYITKGTAIVVPIAVKGVCEVALNADFDDPNRILPKPGQPLYLTIDGALDQGQRAYLHYVLKKNGNYAWLNALRIKVVVAPNPQDKTVLALLP